MLGLLIIGCLSVPRGMEGRVCWCVGVLVCWCVGVCGAGWGNAEFGDGGSISEGITYSACVPAGVEVSVCGESSSDLRYSDTRRDCEVAVRRRVGRLGRPLELPMGD
jgi:hypothetical protein